MIEKLVKAIQSASSIAIISHISPDGDTLGSSLALYHALKNLNKNVQVFCESNIKSEMQDMECVGDYLHFSKDRFDLVIACDCADLGRLGTCVEIFDRAKMTANVDHHKTNTRFGNINIVRGDASSTCEIMYDILSQLDNKQNCFDDSIAKLLYTGMVTDSGGFSFSNVSSNTHLVASKLIKYNIDASKICEKYMQSISMNKFKLKIRVLDKARFFDDNRIGIIHFCREDFEATNTTEDQTEGIINNIRNIDGVDVAIAITDTKNQNSFKISIRTADNVDAAAIASVFGGGGHQCAAGCRANGFYEDVKDKLLKATRDNL